MNSSTATHKTRTLQAREADLTQFVYGKLPPQAPKLEEAILGAIMLDKDAISVVVDILKAESFYDPRNQKVYAAMLHLFADANPIDMLTVTDCLRKLNFLDEVGGAFYLAELTSRVASAANIEYHARIVEQKYIQRQLIQFAMEVAKENYEDTSDIFDSMSSAETKLFKITQGFGGQVDTAAKASANFLKRLELLATSEDELTGLPTGFVEVDRLTGGLQPSDFGIIAARPGMGKSALALTIAKNAAEFEKPVALFSLEMSTEQMIARMYSMEAEISASKFRTGKLEEHEWQQLHTSIEKVSTLPLFIDDTPAINPFELRAKCRRLKMQHDIQLIVVDYLQLMRTAENVRGRNREQEVSEISRSLKALAKELNVPVIALSQLSRAVETRGGTKRPQLSDLRESGILEQDSDWVSFIYRPEYYQIMEDEEGQSLKGVAELIFAKNRHGATRTIKLKWNEQFTRFSDYDEFSYYDNFQSNTFPVPTRSGMNSDEDVPF
ncbi:MAG: replicative DNA helicase [Bacteroidota bacterium]